MTSDRRLVVSEEDLAAPPSASAPAPSLPAPPVAAHAAGAASSAGRLAGISWLPGVVSALVVTVAVGVGVVVVVKPFAGPTSADFCKALRHGQADIRAHLPQTNPHGLRESLGVLGTVFGDIGRFETMLDDLVDNSPSEIRNDMKTSRDTFKQNIDAVPGGIRDPLGTVVAVAMKSVIHQPSFEHVDSYAQDHCGSTVFGTNAR